MTAKLLYCELVFKLLVVVFLEADSTALIWASVPNWTTPGEPYVAGLKPSLK